MRRVLITGMSGTGKSCLVASLRSAGVRAFDADDGWVEVQPDRTQLWNVPAVRELLADDDHDCVVFAGCEENMVEVIDHFDEIILLTVPRDVLVHRLATRTTNTFGKASDELARILTDLDDIEPRLRAIATHVINTNRPHAEVVTEALTLCGSSR